MNPNLLYMIGARPDGQDELVRATKRPKFTDSHKQPKGGYRDSTHTDIAATFRRVQREQEPSIFDAEYELKERARMDELDAQEEMRVPE